MPECRNRIETDQRLVHDLLRTGFETLPDTTPNRKTVGPLLAWSDVAAIWISTEISHKTTAVLRGRKVLKVPNRADKHREAASAWGSDSETHHRTTGRLAYPSRSSPTASGDDPSAGLSTV